MIIFDTHCDTITKIMETGEELYENNGHFDIKRANGYDGFIQTFAAFIDPEFYGNPRKRTLDIIDTFYSQINKYSKYISLCTKSNDIENALIEHKVAALLSIEGGEGLEGRPEAVGEFYNLGVRCIALTWNHKNLLAVGVEDSNGEGLTTAGIEVIHEMNRLGMLLDVSHLSEKSFWESIEVTTSPIIASHSNAKAVCKSIRNLTDEQIMAIKTLNGVIGINLYPEFLVNRGEAEILDIIRHIEYIAGLTGTDHLGFGCDFDGIEKTPLDVRGVDALGDVIDELLKLNYHEDFVEKLSSKNFLRVFKEVCG